MPFQFINFMQHWNLGCRYVIKEYHSPGTQRVFEDTGRFKISMSPTVPFNSPIAGRDICHPKTGGVIR